MDEKKLILSSALWTGGIHQQRYRLIKWFNSVWKQRSNHSPGLASRSDGSSLVASWDPYYACTSRFGFANLRLGPGVLHSFSGEPEFLLTPVTIDNCHSRRLPCDAMRLNTFIVPEHSYQRAKFTSQVCPRQISLASTCLGCVKTSVSLPTEEDLPTYFPKMICGIRNLS